MTPTSQSSQEIRDVLPDAPARILVAEDEALVAQGVVASLEGLGLEVVGPCRDGVDAIETCRAQKPDLALMDIRMPNMDGLEAAKVLFAEMEIPVVILSAFGDDDYLRDSGEAGVFGYLLKPVKTDQLRAGLTVAWQRYLDHMEQRSRIITLEQRLEDRKLIEKAKWIIVDRRGVSEPDAMRLLQQQSRSTRKTITQVAQGVIDSNALL